MWSLIWAVSWLVGVWLGQVVGGVWWVWLGGTAVLTLGAAVGWRKYPRHAQTAVAVALCAAGGGRFLLAQPVLDATHIAFYNNTPRVTLTGLVTAEPDIRDKSINLRVTAESVLVNGRTVPVEGDVLVQLPRFPVIEYGTQLILTADLETPPSDPEFSYRDYLARQGVYSLMQRPQVQITAVRQGNPLYHLLYDAKARGQQTIRQLLPDPEAGLLSGILLGISHAMPPTLDEDFRTTGISHIVVISGFNIAIVAAIFVRMGDPILGFKGSAVGAMVGIVLYTLLVGADPSVVRAAIMGSVYVLGQRWLGRPNAGVGALLLAAVLMTLAQPSALWDVGFQLSFAATLSLMIYATPLTERVRRWLLTKLARPTAEKLLSLLSDALLVTMAAQVLTLPLTMYYFQRLSLISLVANAFILPAQPGVMIWGGLATLLGSVWRPLGVPAGWVAYLFLWYTVRLAQIFARVPYAIVDVPFPFWLLLLTYALIALATLYTALTVEQKAAVRGWLGRDVVRRLVVGGSVVAAVLGGQWYSGTADGLLHVAFLDVGQGDAIFIQTPTGRQILVDGGYYPTVLQDQLGRQMPFWDRDLDIIVATHPDADHVSGLPGLWARYGVGELWVSSTTLGDSPIYDALLTTAEAHQTPLHTAQAGEIILIEDGVRLEILHPPAIPLSDDRNDNSVSLRLVYGDFSLLLTGDAEQGGERTMLASGRPVQALVFKAGHHGSNSSSSAEFLAAIRPQVVVVSAGADNRFGHPTPEMLARAAAVGATVLRTDELGTIAIRTDGRQIWWTARR